MRPYFLQHLSASVAIIHDVLIYQHHNLHPNIVDSRQNARLVEQHSLYNMTLPLTRTIPIARGNSGTLISTLKNVRQGGA